MLRIHSRVEIVKGLEIEVFVSTFPVNIEYINVHPYFDSLENKKNYISFQKL